MMRWRFWDQTVPENNRTENRTGTIPYNPNDEPPPLGDKIQRGMAAQRILGDPTLAEAFDALRRDNYELWLHSKPEAHEFREQLYREAHTLNDVTAKLRGYIGDAKIRRDTAA